MSPSATLTLRVGDREVSGADAKAELGKLKGALEEADTRADHPSCNLPHAKMGKRGKRICPKCKKPLKLEEAKDSMRKASTPKPLSKSKTSNWVARAGGLPPYIQHVAHALMEKRGKSESRAVQMAIGIVKNWKSGKGDVDANTRAAAAKAWAEWLALRAKNAAKKVAKKLSEADEWTLTFEPGALELSEAEQREILEEALALEESKRETDTLENDPEEEPEKHEEPEEPTAERPKPAKKTLESSGERVTQLQARLAALGYEPGMQDGRFGPKTAAAVKEFQSHSMVKVDGIVGPTTTAALTTAPHPDEMRAAEQEGIATPGMPVDGVVPEEPIAGEPVEEPIEPVAEKPKPSGKKMTAAGSGGVLYKGAGVGEKKGSQDVRSVQAELGHLGYDVTTDGRYGPETTKVVKRFQRKWGLNPDGIMGPKTKLAISHVTSKKKKLSEAVETRMAASGRDFTAALARERHLREQLEEGYALEEIADAVGMMIPAIGPAIMGAGAVISAHLSSKRRLKEDPKGGLHVGAEIRHHEGDAGGLSEGTVTGFDRLSGQPFVRNQRGRERLVPRHTIHSVKKESGWAAWRARHPELREAEVEEGLLHRGERPSIDLKRMPDGTFAPKGAGAVLAKGDRVRLPGGGGGKRHGKVVKVEGGKAEIKIDRTSTMGGVSPRRVEARITSDDDERGTKSQRRVVALGRVMGKLGQKEAWLDDLLDKGITKADLDAEVASGLLSMRRTKDGRRMYRIASLRESAELEEGGLDAMAAKLVAAGIPKGQAEAVAAKMLGGKGPGAKRGSRAKAKVELKRLPNGNFAPKGQGQILKAGDKVSVPHKSKPGVMVDGVVESAGKGSVSVKLTSGPDAGKPSFGVFHGDGAAAEANSQSKETIEKLGAPTYDDPYKLLGLPEGSFFKFGGKDYRVEDGDGESKLTATELENGDLLDFNWDYGKFSGATDATTGKKVDIGFDGETGGDESPGPAKSGGSPGTKAARSKESLAALTKNFEGMGKSKLKAQIEELEASGDDPDVLALVKKVAQAKGVSWNDGSTEGAKAKAAAGKAEGAPKSKLAAASKDVGTEAKPDKDAAAKAEPQGAVGSGALAASPGRGPTGKLRNFKAMSGPKLKNTIVDLEAFGEDDEALQAAKAVAIDKGVSWAAPGYTPHAAAYESGGPSVTAMPQAPAPAKGAAMPQTPQPAAATPMPQFESLAMGKAPLGASGADAAPVPGGMGPNSANLSLKDMDLGTTFEMNDGKQYKLHKAVNDPFYIVKPLDGGKAKPLHKMFAPPKVGPVAEGYEGGVPAPPPMAVPPGAVPAAGGTGGGDELFNQLSSSVAAANAAKAAGQPPAAAFKNTGGAPGAVQPGTGAPAASSAESAALAAYKAAGGTDPAIIAALTAKK